MNPIYMASFLKASFDCGEAATEFVRAFPVTKRVLSAKLFVSALGVYAARVNGEKVSFPLAPGWTSYAHRSQVQEYDVTSLIREKNLLSISVAPGWRIKDTPLGSSAAFAHSSLAGTEYAVIAALSIVYADKTEELILSDEDFRCRETKWRACNIYNGDIYDAGYKTDETFPVVVIDYPRERLVPQEGEIIKEHERPSPIALLRTPRGETVLDFGQNLTGYISVSLNLKKGERVVIDHAEILDRDGNFYTDNLRTAKERIVFIGDGEPHVFKPEFTFYGFRYIRLTEWHGDVKPSDFTAIVVHSDMERTGHFECSDRRINQLYHNIIWGQKSNFLDVPTDCPQRNERLGWTGDAEVFARCAGYNFNVNKFFRKWLTDLALDQHPDGGVPHIIPDLSWKKSPACGWADAAVIVPWQMYLLYGDTELLRRQYVSMKRWIDYMYQKGDAYIHADHYGDWLAHDGDPSDYVGKTDKCFLALAYRAYSTSLFLKMSRLLGMGDEEIATCERRLQETKERIWKDYFKDNMLAIDPLTQTGYVIALQFELCPAGTEEAHAKLLAKMIYHNGVRLTTGFLGTPYLLHALSRYGYTELAYGLLFQDQMPSWLFSVDHGATTMWEHWDGIREDGSLWSADMNSFNHYAYGAVGDWLYGVVAGIDTDEEHPGFAKLTFRPAVTDRMDYIKASVDTRFGTVGSSWRHIKDKVCYRFTVPRGVPASAVIGGTTYPLSEGVTELIL